MKKLTYTTKLTFLALTALFLLSTSIINAQPFDKNTLFYAGAESEGLMLSASIREEVSKKQEKQLIIDLLLKNLSEENIKTTVMDSESEYTLDIRNANGEKIKQKELFFGGISHVVTYIKPGEVIKEEYNFNITYNPLPAGTYYMTVNKTVFCRDGKGFSTVISNIVEFEILKDGSLKQQKSE